MTDFEAQLYATLVGAGIATVVSLILAWQSNKAIDKRDREHRKQLQRSMLLKLQIRGSILSSDIASTMNTIDDILRSANELGRVSWPKYAVITPIVGSFESISFSAEELEPLVDANKFEIVHQLVEISTRHQVFIESIMSYNNMRLQLKDKVSVERFDENTGSSLVNDQQLKALQPYFVEMETIISQAICIGRELDVQARKVVAEIGPAAQEYLKDPTFPRIEYAKPPGWSG
ncbi:MAG: hypothetical protein K0S00_1078 [Xanthobacteraceae bacterium]|jgi:hypothetical protein|nr:hypothetical protein [Xanthobacteraceae bacterium]